jgi:rubrerythrin
MATLLARLRRPRADEPDPSAAEKPPLRRRPLPPAGRLRRERRQLLQFREQRIRDLGGLVLEMYRQDRFRQDVVYEQTAEIIAVEDRLREVDRLLNLRANRGARALRCEQCGTPLYEGARFCPSCGRPLAAPAQPEA